MFITASEIKEAVASLKKEVEQKGKMCKRNNQKS